MIAVGSPLWFFDMNCRTYARDEKGRAVGGPIWREHWVTREVIGENRVSWLVGSGGKFKSVLVKLPKKAFADGKSPRGWATSEEHISRLEWAEKHRGRIGLIVSNCHDHDTLRRVAALVGYVP